MTGAAVTDKPWNYLGSRLLLLCGSSIFTFWPPGEIGWGSLGEFVLTRPGHSGKSFPSCSRHCNSVTGPCLAARELGNAGTYVLRKKGSRGIWSRLASGRNRCIFRCQSCRDLTEQGGTMRRDLFLSLSPPEVVRSVFKKKGSWKENDS